MHQTAVVSSSYLSARLDSWGVSFNNKACESLASRTFGIGICAGQQEVPLNANKKVYNCPKNSYESKAVHLPVRFSSIGDPHFLTVDHILVSFLHSPGLYGSHIRACSRLGHTVRLSTRSHAKACIYVLTISMGKLHKY